MKNVSYYLLAGEARAAYQAWREHNEVVLAAHAAWATAALGAGAERRCVYDLNSMAFFGVPHVGPPPKGWVARGRVIPDDGEAPVKGERWIRPRLGTPLSVEMAALPKCQSPGMLRRALNLPQVEDIGFLAEPTILELPSWVGMWHVTALPSAYKIAASDYHLAREGKLLSHGAQEFLRDHGLTPAEAGVH